MNCTNVSTKCCAKQELCWTTETSQLLQAIAKSTSSFFVVPVPVGWVALLGKMVDMESKVNQIQLLRVTFKGRLNLKHINNYNENATVKKHVVLRGRKLLRGKVL